MEEEREREGGNLLDWPELTRLKYFSKIISVHWLQLCHYRGLHSCSARTDCSQQVNQLIETSSARPAAATETVRLLTGLLVFY